MPVHPQRVSSQTGTLTLLEEGIQLAQHGQRAQARSILQRVIHTLPENEDAWLWLAWLEDDKAEGVRLLKEAQQLLPTSSRVREALASLAEPQEKPAPEAQVNEVRQPKPVAAPRKRAPEHKASKPKPAAFVAVQQDADIPTNRSPVFGLLGIAIVAVVVVLGLAGAFRPRPASSVRALELPTRVDAQPTADNLEEQLTSLKNQAETYRAAQDWDNAILTLERIHELIPDDNSARTALAQAYYERGKLRLQVHDLETAQVDLDAAIRLDASNLAVHEDRRALMLYLEGLQAYQLQDWTEVVHCLSRVRKINAGFRDTDKMLAEGYLGVARMQAEKQDWYGARDSLALAVTLDPNFTEAQQAIIQVNDAITPPKRVEVYLGEHLVKVYENHQVIRSFLMCSGKKGSPTLAGRYPVLDKIPLALASQWGGLQMPWWIGLYYTNGDTVNGIENGFHALPYRADQQVMWENSLGSLCSYGCVVLDTKDAVWLYDWIDIGTVVFIFDE
ncbi:MAG: L,D-transpeptidase family protein [Anaerolineae bacterium]